MIDPVEMIIEERSIKIEALDSPLAWKARGKFVCVGYNLYLFCPSLILNRGIFCRNTSQVDTEDMNCIYKMQIDLVIFLSCSCLFGLKFLEQWYFYCGSRRTKKCILLFHLTLIYVVFEPISYQGYRLQLDQIFISDLELSCFRKF